MRIVIGLLALAAGCGDDGNMFPVGGGGNDGGFTLPDGNRPTDATVGDATGDSTVAVIDANQFMGRVCLLTDPRDMDDCAATGAGGLTVRLGTASTTTAADGSFTIEGQSGTGLVWRITGPNIVSSFEPLADYQIPAITTTQFDAMLAGSSPAVMQVAGEGSMMVYVSRNGAGAASQTATAANVTPIAEPPFYDPFYDGATAAAWQQSPGTGAEGGIWVAGLDVGSATLTIDGGGPSITAPIFDGGITFANIILP